MTESTIHRREWYDTAGNPVARIDTPGPEDALVILHPNTVVHPNDVKSVLDQLHEDKRAIPTHRPAKLKKGVKPRWIDRPDDSHHIVNINPMAGTPKAKALNRARAARATAAAAYVPTDQLMSDAGDQPER
jgi:hypothetical protein